MYYYKHVIKLIRKMGVLRFMRTLLRHPATTNALLDKTPVFECLLIDYNANIHYILQKTITELNEILYYVYGKNNKIDYSQLRNIDYDRFNRQNEYCSNLELSVDQLEDRTEYYCEEYQIGNDYNQMQTKLSNDTILTDIILNETIKYTKLLICSLNKGWIKKVYISLDGVPSMAKIQEQRNRRFIGAHINNIKCNIAKKFKFRNNKIFQIDIFKHRSAICTGTDFMYKIQEALTQININLDIEISTIDIQGEGEKKIIYALHDSVSKYESFCIMSPDSDMLILMGLLENNPNFVGKQIYNFRIDYQNKNQYQFFDMIKLVDNFIVYFSEKISKEITRDKMLDLFFMLVVFGNDFLPKLEPLNIIQHFDFVCESCLQLSMTKLQLIHNGKLSHEYLMQFLLLIDRDIIAISIDKDLNEKYSNYAKMCKNLSLSELELSIDKYHHRDLKPFIVTYTNIKHCLTMVKSSYSKLFNYLCQTQINPNDFDAFYKELHDDPADSYLIMILPSLLKFPQMLRTTDSRAFVKKFVYYINDCLNNNNNQDLSLIRFNVNLLVRKNRISLKQESTLTAYLAELEKIDKTLEPYKSMFGVDDIKLITYNLSTNKIVDARSTYYQTYCWTTMGAGIQHIVFEYLSGIEWLYQYYITGKKLEWSGWYYPYTKPPLVQDIINYLRTHPTCQQDIINYIESFPKNNMDPNQHYNYVTPNEYTGASVAPNLSDILHLIDGKGALYLNRCQFKWHEIGL